MNPTSPLANVRIVLSHTSHPGNIGAAARAMKTMGFSQLYLVNPKAFPDREADALASNARDVLETAKVCTTLDDALRDTVVVAALTARHRDLTHQTCDARQAAKKLIQQAQHHPVALLFGRESAGLTAEEVSHCQLTVQIPTDPVYSSLNLAAAVQVMTYELRMASAVFSTAEKIVEKTAKHQHEPANLQELEGFYSHLEQTMIRSGFLNPEEPKRLMRRMRRLFSRTQMEKEEVNILRGILSAVDPDNPYKLF